MNFPLTPVRLGLLTAVVALQACDSSSSDPALQAQAVDGYIVAADVSCDGIPTGNATAAAGRFTCPAGTALMNISGGNDVGFDETATDGGVPFTGELSAPGGLSWVTPLSTLAVAMSTDENGSFNASAFNDATASLAAVFGESELDLSKDPTTLMQLVRLNAQVHQVLTSFVENPDGYAEAVQAFAAVVRSSATNGETYSLSVDANTIMTQLNAQLTLGGSMLALSGTELDSRASAVAAANARLAAAATPDEVVTESKEAASTLAALTLDRDEVQVVFTTSAGGTSSASLEDFENAGRIGGSYRTVLSTSLSSLSYDREFVKVNRALDDVRASIGFEMTSTDNGDQRSLTYVTDDAYLSGRMGDAASLEVRVPEGAELQVRSVSRTGAVRDITIELDNDHAFTNDQGTIRVNNARVSSELASRGIDDVLEGNGNYEVTFVIGGVRVNSETGGVARANGAHTLTTAGSTLSGNGVKGYVTVLDND